MIQRRWPPTDRWVLSDRLKTHKARFVKMTWREIANSIGLTEARLTGLVYGGQLPDDDCDKVQDWLNKQPQERPLFLRDS